MYAGNMSLRDQNPWPKRNHQTMTAETSLGHRTWLYTDCSISNATLNTKHKPLHAQNDETNGNFEFFHPYPVVATEALLDICTSVISAVLSLDEHLSETKTSCVTKYGYQSVHSCLIQYFLSEYALLNASQTATNYFDAN
jgi:hypothetical protein